MLLNSIRQSFSLSRSWSGSSAQERRSTLDSQLSLTESHPTVTVSARRRLAAPLGTATLFAIILATSSVRADGPPTSSAALANDQGKDRLERLAAAARKEGSLS